MENITRIFLFFLLIICSSCSSLYRFSVDVQEPALITLPVSAQNVLILNNTVAQPVDYGIERNFNGQSIPADYPLSLDSVSWSAIKEIAIVLDESNFFNSIAIYDELLRKDTQWLTSAYLSQEKLYDFFDNKNFDALFVVERLLINAKEDAKTIQSGAPPSEPNIFIDMRVEGVITCSMYTYGKERPLTTFNVTDSFYIKTTSYNDSIIIFKEIPEFTFHSLCHMLGEKAAKSFVPTWKTEERNLFVSYNSRMQEAVGYAANRRWANAESIWITELEKNTKPLNKAKIAFNLAVANEMQDKFEPALEWALKAKEYLKNSNKSNDNQEIELTDKYIAELERRIQSNRLLDLQWGTE